MRSEERRQRLSLTILFSGIFFVSFIITGVVVAAIIMLLLHFGVLRLDGSAWQAELLVASAVLACILLGTLLSGILSRYPLKPVSKIVTAVNRLAAGDFRTRLEFKGRFAGQPLVRQMTDSFNTMAAELENTEMLRSDFINNFSHEFKTPIVSIAGFAKLLKRGNLPEEEQREYLDIIESESLRLAAMATNVLNMTKVENQTILTDVTRFNLSEQIRNCVLLLEPKWSKKGIEWDMEFDEHVVSGNRELLQEVWVNLIDNAIKFSPAGATVTITLKETDAGVAVCVKNQGPDIPADRLGDIFRKFYQVDGSHAAEGNGVGLAIVKRVTELHGGRVSVGSGGGSTAFTVVLPEHRNEEKGKK